MSFCGYECVLLSLSGEDDKTGDIKISLMVNNRQNSALIKIERGECKDNWDRKKC